MLPMYGHHVHIWNGGRAVRVTQVSVQVINLLLLMLETAVFYPHPLLCNNDVNNGVNGARR